MEQHHHCSLLHHHHHHHHHHLYPHTPSLCSPPPHNHHHHHHHVVPSCGSHNHFLQNPNSNFCHHLIIIPPPQIPQTLLPLPFRNNPNHVFSGFQPPHTSHNSQNFQGNGIDESEDVEDEEPIFVMTDEWSEFFAKSEARRREAKKLAKKQGKT
ncbi:uncharacterized protein LOC104908782 [Beta vulgaris subsp. vulgaris]|uniref:uncharacterized protein LOC104908782 n=1 Tax=Beta vulgaris subsp. vulgaris TaxID=3555 RepID=UPI002036A7A5|nr:uncharacterized protein LOC104908782 [Beta vulgaris subsp. vulgaris]